MLYIVLACHDTCSRLPFRPFRQPSGYGLIYLVGPQPYWREIRSRKLPFERYQVSGIDTVWVFIYLRINCVNLGYFVPTLLYHNYDFTIKWWILFLVLKRTLRIFSRATPPHPLYSILNFRLVWCGVVLKIFQLNSISTYSRVVAILHAVRSCMKITATHTVITFINSYQGILSKRLLYLTSF